MGLGSIWSSCEVTLGFLQLLLQEENSTIHKPCGLSQKILITLRKIYSRIDAPGENSAEVLSDLNPRLLRSKAQLILTASRVLGKESHKEIRFKSRVLQIKGTSLNCKLKRVRPQNHLCSADVTHFLQEPGWFGAILKSIQNYKLHVGYSRGTQPSNHEHRANRLLVPSCAANRGKSSLWHLLMFYFSGSTGIPNPFCHISSGKLRHHLCSLWTRGKLWAWKEPDASFLWSDNRIIIPH